uniref:Very-long-chain (3R)-3-hydroxyacyl-CoA dehydratase n=1 Tax=Hucho hucho TaxID=62062 RepID=A0A4W5KKU0_9TELE
DNVLQFRAQGHGARGQNDYEFSLPFLNAVKTEVSHRSTQRQVNITVRKHLSGWWDRLALQEKKPLFLAPDFDRWMDESDAEMELREKVTSCNINADSLVLQQMQLINLLQLGGRIPSFRLSDVPKVGIEMFRWVYTVFYLWSAIEIFRYPFYMLGCIDTEWKTITWLRYTIWIPLYPLGVLAEAVAVVQSISVFDQSRLFSIPLPKALGSSVSFSCVLYIYLPLMVIGELSIIVIYGVITIL